MSIIKNLSNVITGDLNRKIEDLNYQIENLKQLNDGQTAIIKLLGSRLLHAHLRDPRTGRIMPMGKHTIGKLSKDSK